MIGLKKQALLCASLARELLDYDQSSGVFTWKVSPRMSVRQGAKAGWVHPRGYTHINIKGRTYAAHRLAWLWVTGTWPDDQIDHINGERSDNRFANLRMCTGVENVQNTGIYRNNKSGYPGVGFHKASGRWRARIDRGNRQKHLGLFDTAEEAFQAYLLAKRSEHSFQPEPRYVGS